jgi:hypothetical protein
LSALDSSLAFEKALAATALAMIMLAGLIAVLAGYFIISQCIGGQDEGGSRLARAVKAKSVETRASHFEDRDQQTAAAMPTSTESGPVPSWRLPNRCS